MKPVPWDEQVKVDMLAMAAVNPGHSAIQSGVPKWDGISLEEAVRRVRAMPDKEQIHAVILAPSGLYYWTDIAELSRRPDFPKSEAVFAGEGKMRVDALTVTAASINVNAFFEHVVSEINKGVAQQIAEDERRAANSDKP
jgi:hypothetical protein